MESSYNYIHKLRGCNTEILRKRLLKTPYTAPPAQPYSSNSSQHRDDQMNNIRPPTVSSGMLKKQQSTKAISHGLIAHSHATMKPQGSSSYPLQLHLGGGIGSTTVNVPMQISGSNTNINMPVQLTGAPGTVPLQLTAPTVGLPASVPVQLPGGAAISVPLQFPSTSQNIQLAGGGLPSMPLLQTSAGQPPFSSSIIHVHVGSNVPRSVSSSVECSSESSYSTVNNAQLPSTSSAATITPIQMGGNHLHVLPGAGQQLGGLGGGGGVRGGMRGVPQVVYIQTPGGVRPVTSTDINSASSSGTPPHIIVRRPVTSSSGFQIVSNANTKSNLAPKGTSQNKSSLLAPVNSAQPIVIQKPKTIVPVSIATNTGSKQTFAYLGTVKKQSMNKVTDTQSILLANNPMNPSNSQNPNHKLFLAPMSVPHINTNKIQNTKYILPVSLPGSMSNKGPIINLQIANGQLQNDPQGNITVMRDSTNSDMPPLQPLAKAVSTTNGKDMPQTSRSDNTYAMSIPGSRAEPTGEQEYTLSIPETNATMNDDIYTVSIADEDEGSATGKSFTLSIPEKGKSLLNKKAIEKCDVTPAPAILRRSNSDNTEKRSSINSNIKRRISLCTEKTFHKKHLKIPQTIPDHIDSDNNEDHQVPSLFCDEEFDKDLEMKGNSGDNEDNKQSADVKETTKTTEPEVKQEIKHEEELGIKHVPSRAKSESTSMDSTSEEDPPGLLWSNGVAMLQGSNLHFQTNEFGLIDVIDNSEREQNFHLNPSSKYQTPLKQRVVRGQKKPTSPEDLYCCDGCGCHGMAADFITPNFCSLTCQQVYQKLAPQRKKERDKADLMKKRNKIKKLLAKQRLDTEPRASSVEHLQIEERKNSEPKLPEPDGRLLNPLLIKVTEEPFENDKYPWMCGKNGFSWMRYLDYSKAKAAPTKSFAKDPFPYNVKNGFRVGMKLEAIDPMRPAVFSVVTVAETQGYRMRLHFDSYHETFDYWVNADSIDIFPPGWCEKNGRVLKPPQGFTTTNFSWAQYLKQSKAIAAPRHLFPHMCQTMLKPNGFRTGMKLEAEDRKDNLICVASVSDMLDNRILVNFDSWDDKYDYWVDPTSPYIHPVGWAEENGHSLTPPNFYKDPDSFTWEEYLQRTDASAVPARAFKPRPPHTFKSGMKLEVVDKRVPFLIRVATISDTRAHQVLVAYDGWPDSMSVWLDDDSPDLHPVGWCLKTGHPLEPPLSEEELRTEGLCGVGGCRGLGSLRGGAHKTHSYAWLCPYRAAATPYSPPDRLAASPAPAALQVPRTRTVPNAQRGRPRKYAASTPTSDTLKEKNQRNRPAKHKRVEEISKDQLSDEESRGSSGGGGGGGGGGGVGSGEAGGKRARSGEAEVEASVLAREYEVRAGRRPPRWGALCPDVAMVLRRESLPADPRLWTEEEVGQLAESADAAGEAAERLRRHRVAGAELLMLSQEELVDVLGLKLGPAIKLYSMVLQLRAALLSRL